ncbi:hypothetical protein FB565_007642 [Actinoplanes lutulentus]|uniref:Uncharacterized protein n=1 Tax=Actinoplanes lutulentus TaxID=1287878 RepID=A0A327Z6D0_9ACTN|nr:hypothetical protein [Actinoplanes lutulentus]MBB2947871.1 hypothetical protein [Actinoplanes lutulentus]RAK29816.1 hypothetical protein B0I29_117142 [Actinoplanes lutulentus]
MVCSSCGLDNDPSATFCARCNATLGSRSVPFHEEPAFEEPTFAYAQPRRFSSPLPLIAAGVVLLLLVVVIGVVIASRDPDPVAGPGPGPGPVPTTTDPVPTTDPTTDSTTPPTTSPAPEPTANPQEQAAVIDAILDRSVASRGKLNAAIKAVGGCDRITSALADMREVGVERRQQISEVEAADLSGLAGGETLRSALTTALGHSLDADEHFVAWAEPAVAGDCADSSSRSAAWARGQSSSDLAQAAKKQFVAAWNPVATPLGFAKRTNKNI